MNKLNFTFDEDDSAYYSNYKGIKIWLNDYDYPKEKEINEFLSFLDTLPDDKLAKIQEILPDFDGTLNIFWKQADEELDKNLLPKIFKTIENFYPYVPDEQIDKTGRVFWYADRGGGLWVSGSKPSLWTGDAKINTWKRENLKGFFPREF